MSLDAFDKQKFLNIENDAFKAMQRIFPCEENLIDKIPLDQIISHFQEKIQASEHPFLVQFMRSVLKNMCCCSITLVVELEWPLFFY